MEAAQDLLKAMRDQPFPEYCSPFLPCSKYCGDGCDAKFLHLWLNPKAFGDNPEAPPIPAFEGKARFQYAALICVRNLL